MRVRDWLELAIDIEDRSALLYERFGSLFMHHPELAAYWGAMEADEKRHGSILREVMGRMEEADGRKAITEHSAEKTKKLMSCIQDDLLRVFNSLDDAYECAHELEEKEVEIIFDLLKEDSVNKYEGVHTLLKEDQEHLQKLIDFGDVFGKAEWRKIIKASAKSEDAGTGKKLKSS